METNIDHKITFRALLENTTMSCEYKKKHGLCIYIETPNHKILFDLGPNDLFYKNALKMGIDISKVDTVIISHGHLDHGGGLKAFFAHNNTAKVYINKEAFNKHTTKVLGINFNCGINPIYKNHPQVVLVDDTLTFDEDGIKYIIFSDIKTKDYFATSNSALFMEEDGKLVEDNFHHEQNLLILDHGKSILFAGCAHRGIVNIVRRAKELNDNKDITCSVGGFHLYNPNSKKYESDEFIKGVGNELYKTPTIYFTCHCTGPKAVDILKTIMHEKIQYLSTGRKVEIEITE